MAMATAILLLVLIGLMFMATLIVALNLIVDILYAVIDPRVRYR